MATTRKDINGFNQGKSLNECICDVMNGKGTRIKKKRKANISHLCGWLSGMDGHPLYLFAPDYHTGYGR